jgi:hypothetical protein
MVSNDSIQGSDTRSCSIQSKTFTTFVFGIASRNSDLHSLTTEYKTFSTIEGSRWSGFFLAHYNYHLDCPIVEKIEYYTLFNPFYIDIFPRPRQNYLNSRVIPSCIFTRRQFFGSARSPRPIRYQIDRSRRDRQGFPSIRCHQSSGSARRQSYSDLLIKGTFEGGYPDRE